ncbi:beta-ketoacyl-ACP reductase [Salinibacterium xinjiangense]|uniref:NAD(P)-dependent dehydrogenase, short-chain alcohol dehydrogenase family n=1 Tax=Salinibacterium xinjiangense TaxID=386302 RepID=A0A2C8Z5Z5_9MICO|nr:SDR family oxidoreductase [Salinibacterium xinjiangense]GGK92829.1 beta-ketoacyl-ACP reductase [Salinibacterium xinjiangense]SOE59206.1 NAD(P)-dependent dehydrogenase, short-chain alcohol dehydrogenase family [Salinibacterium xinjiangense]
MTNESVQSGPHGTKQLALITGGLGDIGRAIANSLARDGFDCLLVDVVDPEVGIAQSAEIAASADVGPESLTYAQCDVRNAAALETLISGLPRLDVAVVNAGVVQSSPFLTISADSWERQIGINLTGAFFTAQSATRKMAADDRSGLVIFMSSWVASRPWPEIAAYSASKAALDQLMRQIAMELAPLKIRAMSIAPGIVRAGMARDQLENEPQYAARVSRSIPLGEPQQAQDIADAVAFLASPRAKTMTGSVLLVDAGCSLGAAE